MCNCTPTRDRGDQRSRCPVRASNEQNRTSWAGRRLLLSFSYQLTMLELAKIPSTLRGSMRRHHLMAQRILYFLFAVLAVLVDARLEAADTAIARTSPTTVRDWQSRK